MKTPKITAVTKRIGLTRYRLSFSSGMPFDFLVENKHKWATDREWQGAFLRGLKSCCVAMLKNLEEE